MSGNPYQSPEAEGEMPARGLGMSMPGPFTLLTIFGVIAVGVALFLPNVRGGGREAARRVQCSNNLKQIALALRNYEFEYHSLPPAYTVDENGAPLHSWRTLILPYLEQQALYETMDLSKPWNDPANRAAYETSLAVYRCPSADRPPSHTTYFAVVAPHGCFRSAEPRTFAEITDDHHLTLIVMEFGSPHAVHWMSPTDMSEHEFVNFGAAGKLPHPGGAQAAFVSGRVQFLASGTDAATLRALISIDGNDDATARAAD